MHYSMWTLAGFAVLGSAFLVSAADAKPTSRCHASYPDYCIAPGPPDLNCPDIRGARPFRVRHDVADPDPHGFDRDRDGLGCETGRARRRSRQD